MYTWHCFAPATMMSVSATARRSAALSRVGGDWAGVLTRGTADCREGNVVPGTAPGPVVFVLETQPHARFSRNGADLVYKAKVLCAPQNGVKPAILNALACIVTGLLHNLQDSTLHSASARKQTRSQRQQDLSVKSPVACCAGAAARCARWRPNPRNSPGRHRDHRACRHHSHPWPQSDGARQGAAQPSGRPQQTR